MFKLKGKKKHAPDYKAFFIMGIVWLPFGIIMGNHALTAMGIIFMIVGLVNKKKWKEQRTWKDMNKREKKLMTVSIIILGLLFLMGVVAFFLFEKGLL